MKLTAFVCVGQSQNVKYMDFDFEWRVFSSIQFAFAFSLHTLPLADYGTDFAKNGEFYKSTHLFLYIYKVAPKFFVTIKQP